MLLYQDLVSLLSFIKYLPSNFEVILTTNLFTRLRFFLVLNEIY